MMMTKKKVKMVVKIGMMMMMVVLIAKAANDVRDTTSEKLLKKDHLKETSNYEPNPLKSSSSSSSLIQSLPSSSSSSSSSPPPGAPSMEVVLFNPPRRKEASQAGVQIQSSVSHKSEELSNLSTWNTKESSSSLPPSSSSLIPPTSSSVSSISSHYPSSPSDVEQLGIPSISRDLFQHSSQLSYERTPEVDNTQTSSLPLSSPPPSFIPAIFPSSTFASTSSSSSTTPPPPPPSSSSSSIIAITKPSIFQSSSKFLPQNTLVSSPAILMHTISSSLSSLTSSSSSSSSQVKQSARSLSSPIVTATDDPPSETTPSISSSPPLVIFSPDVIKTLITRAIVVHSSVTTSSSSSSTTITSSSSPSPILPSLLSSPSPLPISPSLPPPSSSSSPPPPSSSSPSPPSSSSSLSLQTLSPITKSSHSLSIYPASLTSISLILSPPSSSPQPPPSSSSPSLPPPPSSSSFKSHPSSSLRPSIQCAGHAQLFNFLVSTVKNICLTTDILGGCVDETPVALNRSEKPEECNVCLCVQITRTFLRLSCENESRCQDLVGNSRDRVTCFNITLTTSCMARMTADESSIEMNGSSRNESREQVKKKLSRENNSLVKRSLKDAKSTFHEDIPVKIHQNPEKEVTKNNATESSSHTTNDSQLQYVLRDSAPNHTNDLNVVTLVLSPEESRKSKLRTMEMMRLHKDWKESVGFRDSAWYNSPTVIAVLMSLGASLFLVVACIFGFVVADVISTNRRRFLRSKVSPLLESSELLP